MGVPYNNIQRRMKFSLIKALKIGRKYAFQEFYRLIADILLYCQKYNDDQIFFAIKEIIRIQNVSSSNWMKLRFYIVPENEMQEILELENEIETN